MIKFRSSFKNGVHDAANFYEWVERLAALTKRNYQRRAIETPLGITVVWTIQQNSNLPPLLIFPGYRTTPLIWDLDNGLDHLLESFQLYLVETNGQPNPSDGNTPSIRTDGYGQWAVEVLNKLKIQKSFVAGASFGGLVAMKLCKVAPERVQACFLLNPAGLRDISFGAENLFYNVLPIFNPSKKNIQKFLNHVVFCKPNHGLSAGGESLLIEYLQLAITRCKDKAQKPYYLKGELKQVVSDVHLIFGERDILMPYRRSKARAQHFIPSIKSIHTFPEAGHGIETDSRALKIIAEIYKKDYQQQIKIADFQTI